MGVGKAQQISGLELAKKSHARSEHTRFELRTGGWGLKRRLPKLRLLARRGLCRLGKLGQLFDTWLELAEKMVGTRLFRLNHFLLTQVKCQTRTSSFLKCLTILPWEKKKWLDGVYEIVFRFLTKLSDFLVSNYLEIPISLRKHWLEFILVLVTLVFWIQMFRVYMKFNLD